MTSSSSLHSTQDTTDDKPVGSLDWRQVVGGAGAASIVAYASSRVGLAGTIFGAAAMSILAALTSAYLARAAHQTERQVRRVTRHRGAAASAHAPTAAESSDTGPDVALPHPEPADTSPASTAADPDAATAEQGQPLPWRRLALFAGVVFAVTIAAVVAVGIATGAEQPTAPLAPPAVTSESPQPTVTSTPTQDDESTSRPTPTTTSTATSTPTSTPTRTPTPSVTGATGPAATGSPTSRG